MQKYIQLIYIYQCQRIAENNYKGFAHWLDLQAKEEYFML